MNQVTIAGHLGADPEVRFTSSGQKVTALSVAARARRSGKEEATIWWKVTIWGEQFDKIIPYFKKGSSTNCPEAILKAVTPRSFNKSASSRLYGVERNCIPFFSQWSFSFLKSSF